MYGWTGTILRVDLSSSARSRARLLDPKVCA